MTAVTVRAEAMSVVDQPPSLGEELRTVGMVWERELIRFERTRSRIFSGFIQPFVFLFVLGYGMSTLTPTIHGFGFTKFVLPGVVAMTVSTTAIGSPRWTTPFELRSAPSAPRAD